MQPPDVWQEGVRDRKRTNCGYELRSSPSADLGRYRVHQLGHFDPAALPMGTTDAVLPGEPDYGT
jgi:hypothetical protein